MSNPSNEWQKDKPVPCDHDGRQPAHACRICGPAKVPERHKRFLEIEGAAQPVEAAKDSVCECGGSREFHMRHTTIPCPDCQPKDPAAQPDGDFVYGPNGGDIPAFHAAQTPEAEFAENMGAIADKLAGANVPDRTEGEGPFYVHHNIDGSYIVRTEEGTLRAADNFWELEEATRWCNSYNACWKMGQASTHPRIERLERIEVAVKAAVQNVETAIDQNKRGLRISPAAVAAIEMGKLAALLDDEGDGAK